MKKKILAAVMAATMVFSLVACGKRSNRKCKRSNRKCKRRNDQLQLLRRYDQSRHHQ